MLGFRCLAHGLALAGEALQEVELVCVPVSQC